MGDECKQCTIKKVWESIPLKQPARSIYSISSKERDSQYMWLRSVRPLIS